MIKPICLTSSSLSKLTGKASTPAWSLWTKRMISFHPRTENRRVPLRTPLKNPSPKMLRAHSLTWKVRSTDLLSPPKWPGRKRGPSRSETSTTKRTSAATFRRAVSWSFWIRRAGGGLNTIARSEGAATKRRSHTIRRCWERSSELDCWGSSWSPSQRRKLGWSRPLGSLWYGSWGTGTPCTWSGTERWKTKPSTSSTRTSTSSTSSQSSPKCSDDPKNEDPKMVLLISLLYFIPSDINTHKEYSSKTKEYIRRSRL